MKRNNTTRVSVILTLVMLSSQLVAAQSPEVTRVPIPAADAASSIHISAVTSSNTPNGSLVSIRSDSTLTDFGAYRNGETFIVLIPQASMALNNVNVTGTAFSHPRVEAKGTNLIFSFRLVKGVSAGVTQRGHLLEVSFVSGDAGAIRAAARPESGSVDEPDHLAASTAARPEAVSRTVAIKPRVANPAPAPLAETINQVDVDLAVPESPAFTVLGVTPNSVTRPTTPREFATSLLNGVDQRGNFQTGLALDFVPFLTFFGKNTSLFSYVRNPMERFLARTQFSFATTKGATEEDKSARLALGLRLTLWDRGDPRLDPLLEECYDAADEDQKFEEDEYLPAPGDTPQVVAKKLAKRKQLLAELVKPCNDAARKRNWNGSGLIIGAAPSWISQTGQTRNFVWNGGGFWTSFAYGFEGVSALKDNSQFILHARYRSNEIVPDSINRGNFFSQDSLFFGGRFRLAPGSEANTIFSLEGNLVRSRQNKGDFENASRYSLSFEKRLAENIWFTLALGGQSGRTDGNNQAFVLSSFNWGFSQKKK